MELEDPLSNLPKAILHDILSRLPEEDAARTSVLSKSWAETWSTFPVLSFSDTKIIGKNGKNFIQSEDYLNKRKEFLEYVERTLLRFHNQLLTIKELKLSVNYLELHDISQDVDIWFKLASESSVEVLKLYLAYGDSDALEEIDKRCYILPTAVLQAKSLTKLVLTGRIGVDLSFMNHSMKFFFLRELSLARVLLGDEQAFENLISHCPLIEYITLRWCCVAYPGGEWRQHDSRNTLMKSLSICGLSRLRGVEVQGTQEVYIDAPSLEKLCYHPSSSPKSVKMDFNRCRNLKKLSLLSLWRFIITDKWFDELFAKFPFLESLKLDSCRLSERINISSVQLKVLELLDCSKLKEVNIDAPNISSCFYKDWRSRAVEPIISFSGCTSPPEVNVLFHVNYVDLCNLREFIQKLKPQTVLVILSLFINPQIADALDPFDLQVSSPPPSIKHLVLHYVPKNDALYFPLVNRLLSICCPATILISSRSFVFCNRAFIEFLYETLMGRNADECVCSSSHTKCWWHGLKSVKVTSSMKIGENIDFTTMLDALQTSQTEENISFSLEF